MSWRLLRLRLNVLLPQGFEDGVNIHVAFQRQHASFWKPPLIFRIPGAHTFRSPRLGCWQVPLSTLLLVLLVKRMISSPWGRILKAVREDEEAVRSLGKNVFAYKLQGLIMGGMIGALAGMLLAIEQQNEMSSSRQHHVNNNEEEPIETSQTQDANKVSPQQDAIRQSTVDEPMESNNI